MANILIEHGSSYNLGDTAMLEGVVCRWIENDPNSKLYVRETQSVRTALWNWPNISRVELQVLRPIHNLQKIPIVRREEWRIRPLWIRLCHVMLGRMIQAQHIPITNRFGARTTLGKWCEPYDALHIVGGGNLTDTFPNNFWQRCCLIETFASQGKPILLTGQQIGPFSSRLTEHSLQRAVRKAAFVGLREPTESVRFCERTDLSPDRFEVMGDDSFGLAAAPEDQIEALLQRYHLDRGRFLAVNIRIGNYAASHAQYVQQLADFIAKLFQRYSLPIVVVPIAMNNEDSDIASGYRLVQACRGVAIQVLDEPALSPGLVKALLGQAYAAIGVSYHFCTFTLSQGVPAICLFDGAYYGQKASGLSSFWGDQRLALSLKQLNSMASAEQVYGLIEDQAVRQILQARAKEAINRWRNIFDCKVHQVLLQLSSCASTGT